LLFAGAVLLAIFVLPAPWGLALVGAAAVVEIAETFFWIRLSRRWRVRAGAETLIGARAEVASACRPLGQVRVAGELWRARCEAGADVGASVRIRGRDGLTLLVEPE
jgi:membrane-bound serine protease (ClpP class)